MNAMLTPEDGSLSLFAARKVDHVCDRFEADFRGGNAPRIEAFLDPANGEGASGTALLRALLLLELELRRARGEQPSAREYAGRFPGHTTLVADAFAGAPTRPQRPRHRYEIGRSLLVGILALQHNFIGRDELLAAFNAWVADGSQSFGALLTARAMVSPERRALLEALAGEHLKQHGDDPEASLAAVSAYAPSYEFLYSISDPEAKTSLGAIRTDSERSVGNLSGESTLDWADARFAADNRGRFRVLRLHSGGGLGEIFIAHDLELDREVALKELKPTTADKPDDRARFIFEAEINGGLEHPSIVPVYGRGQHDNGRPYYVMRFVRGKTFHQAIGAFHRDAPGRDPAERALALRELLDRFLDICDAIGYAHYRGVLHRDLKPSNVLLGCFGETLVADWGLARLIDRVAEPDAAALEPTLRPVSASSAGHTLGGRAIGTIGYMPPEQAEGRLDRLGPASDVYSLGAILYTLLTGQTSVRSKGRWDLERAIADIVAGNFARPRAVNPKVNPALEAVCLKAMATAPADRYPGPRALADEIKHWLADERVSAYREPWNQRLARWTRRHRAWAQAAAVSLVVVTLVSSAAVVAVARAYRNEQRAHAQSEADFRTARDAARGLYKAASRGLASLANSEAARERLAARVVDSYKDLLKARPDDPTLRREAGEADRELANRSRLLGLIQPANASYDRAIARFRATLTEYPEDQDSRDALALTLADLGELHRMSGRTDQALTVLREALDLARGQRAKAAEDVRWMRTEAFALKNLAAALFDVGQFDDCRRSSEESLSLWSTVAASPRADPLVDPVYAIFARAEIGAALREVGDTAGSRKAYREALANAMERANKNPDNSDTLVALAGVRIGYGELLLDSEPAEAGALYEGSITDLARVIPQHRRVPSLRLELAFAHRGLAGVRLAARQFPAASASCAAAHELLLGLLKERRLPGYYYGLGRVLADQARIARALGRPDQARSLFGQAIEQHELAIRINSASVLNGKQRRRCLDELQALDGTSDARTDTPGQPSGSSP